MITPEEVQIAAQADAEDAAERVRASKDGGPLVLADRDSKETEFKKRVAQYRAEDWPGPLWPAYLEAFKRFLVVNEVGLIERPAEHPDLVPENFYVIDRRRWEREDGDEDGGPFIAFDLSAGWQRKADA